MTDCALKQQLASCCAAFFGTPSSVALPQLPHLAGKKKKKSYPASNRVAAGPHQCTRSSAATPSISVLLPPIPSSARRLLRAVQSL